MLYLLSIVGVEQERSNSKQNISGDVLFKRVVSSFSFTNLTFSEAESVLHIHNVKTALFYLQGPVSFGNI